MFLRSFYKSILESTIITTIIIATMAVAVAQVRSSSNYQLQGDSVNFGGGLSTSTNYSMESTAGEVATGNSDSSTYSLRAGYQQMNEVFLSLSAAANVVMSPNIAGISGGVANGSTSVTVLTDSPSGYQLSIEAENNPAMQMGAESILDYVPVATPDPDFIFETLASQAWFGFSPEGNDISSRFLNDGVDCNTGTNKTPLACWDGLSTSPKIIAEGSANQPSGTETKINFRIEIGGSAVVVAGEYVATTTLTALPL